MLDLGELAARIRVDDSDVPRGLARTHRRFEQFHSQTEAQSGMAGSRAGERLSGGFSGSVRSGLGRATTGVGRILGGGAAMFASFGAAGVAALGAVGGAGLGMGVKIAAGNENAQIAFTTMLGSGKRARSFLGELQQFAAKTPFEFPELQTAASSLISAGVNAKNVIPIMTSLGNATSGMGTGAEGVKRATVALQQMNAAGRITAEDLNQLRDAGIPVYDLLASATGKSKKEVAALAQTGKLGAKELNQLMAALADGKGLERFNGLMEKQSASLAGMWSTVKDNLGQGLAKAVAPVIPLLKDGMGGAADLIARSLAKLPPVLKGTVRFIRALSGEVSEFWQATKAREAAPLSAALHSIWASLVLLFPALKSTKSAAGGLGDTFPIVGAVIHGAVKFVELLARGLAWLADNQDVVRAGASRLGDAIRPVGEWIKGAWDKVRGIDGADVSRAFDQVVSVVSRLGPMLRDFSGSLPALKPLLNDTGKVLGFVADHADLVGKALPYLIAGFAAYKAAQAANATVGRESLVGFGLQLASTIALTGSNFALAASQRAVEGTERVSNRTRLRSVAAMVAHGAATVASTVATVAAGVASKVFAAGQWLVNAALSANPIGLVVIAIAALVGGLIYAYKHSERFRKIVDATFSWVKENVPKALRAAWHGIKVAWDAVLGAFSSAKDWVLGAFHKSWGTIKAILLGPIGGAALAIYRHWDDITGAFRKARSWVTGTWRKGWGAVTGAITGVVTRARDRVEAAWDDVRGKFTAARRWVTGTWRKGWGAVSGAISGAVTSARERVSDAWDSVRDKFNSVRRWVTGTFRRSWNGIKLLITNPVEFARNVVDTLLGKDTGVRRIFDSLGRWVRGAFRRAWNGVKALLNDPVKAARDAIVKILGADDDSGLRGRFSGFVRAAGRIWDGLKSAMKSPIVAVIKIVNEGLIGAYNWVIDKLKIGGRLDPISIKGFRTGGATSYTGSDDDTVGVVHGNEHVWTAREVRALGGHKRVEALRRAAVNGDLHDMPGYAQGGAALHRPVRGGGNPSRVHDGYTGFPALDFAVGTGSPVAAAASGKVSRSQDIRGGQNGGYRSYGRVIQIIHNGFQTLYAHLSSRGARVGQQVRGGEVIGRSGNTGNSTGPHLHFGSKGISPLRFLSGSSTFSGGSGGDGGGGDVSVKAGWLGAFANPAAFLRDRATKAMDAAGLGGLGSGGWGGVVRAMPGGLLDKAVDKMKSVPSSAWHSIKAVVGSVVDTLKGAVGKGMSAARKAAARLGAHPITNHRDPSGYPSFDAMSSGSTNSKIASHLLANHAAYGIRYIISQMRIASARGNWGWRRYSPITNQGDFRHTGHVHATFYGNGTKAAAPGFAWTGDKGAELVLNPQMRKYGGGEQVLTKRQTERVLGGGSSGPAQPLIGQLTIQGSGSVHRDLDEVMFRVRVAGRGGVYGAAG